MSQNTRERILSHLIGILSASVLFLALAVAWRSFGPVFSPIKSFGMEYTAIKIYDGTVVITLEATLNASSDVDLHVHRVLTHNKTGLTIDLPTTEHRVTEGMHVVKRQFYVPSPVPNGDWCIDSKIDYRPFMSLVDREMKGVRQCFDVH